MNISVQSLKDFQVCERYFDYRYNDLLPVPQRDEDLMFERFERTLKRVVSFFFYRKQGEVPPSFSSLLNRWEKLWFPKGTTAYDIATQRNRDVYKGSLVSYSTMATAALLKFHEDFGEENEFQPLLIDETFLVPIRKDLRLQGTFDLVLRRKNDHTVIKWFVKPHRHHTERFQFDFSALRYAYEHRNTGRDINVEYGFYDLTSANPGFTTFKITQNDIDTMLYWANRLYETKDFISRRGFTIYCRECPFNSECANWSPTHG